jgi:hypothetical protein
LPEFRVPTQSISEFEIELDGDTVNAGSVNYVCGTWTIAFSNEITAAIKERVLAHQGGTIEFYLVVRDLAGNESGSMNKDTYEVVEYTW